MRAVAAAALTAKGDVTLAEEDAAWAEAGATDARVEPAAADTRVELICSEANSTNSTGTFERA